MRYMLAPHMVNLDYEFAPQTLHFFHVTSGVGRSFLDSHRGVSWYLYVSCPPLNYFFVTISKDIIVKASLSLFYLVWFCFYSVQLYCLV